MNTILPLLAGCCLLPAASPVSLRETVRASALFDLARGPVAIRGSAPGHDGDNVAVRVTDARGRSWTARVRTAGGAFRCAYPVDFAGAPALSPGALFVDATLAPAFDGVDQAEATVLVFDGRRRRLPDLPSGFETDLTDRRGRVDSASATWPADRALLNLYMRSRAARIAGVGRADFDLAKPDDLAWFKKNMALYDFDHRDRDWRTPLGHRAARTFWQSVWDTWFNASNDDPIDGNPRNTSPANYRPYAFSNDFADTLILHIMRLRSVEPTEEHLPTLSREGTENLLAMQHTEASNFALPDQSGHREVYTAGAFRYGMFDDGAFMTEGTGWFYNPAFKDYAAGGVLNGRCVWALGEALKAEPKGPLAPRLRQAIALALRFCLRDALEHGYAQRTSGGRVYWRDAGEHAYLLLGMVAACGAAPNLPVPIGEGGKSVPLREATSSALSALVDLEQPAHQWSVYPNVDSMAIAALAEGALAFPADPQAARWRTAAVGAADAWIGARVDPKEYPGAAVHFGPRIGAITMTYNWSHLAPSLPNRNFLYFYQSGHWIHALARLYALTGDTRYRSRAEAMASYLCGDNPWGVRLLNELGGVYNWVEDTDGDGVEDQLKQDMYPESTDFCGIGVLHLLDAAMRR